MIVEIFIIISIVIINLAIIGRIRTEYWITKICVGQRLQISYGLLFVAFSSIFMELGEWKYLLLVSSLALFFLNGKSLFPFTPLARKAVKTTKSQARQYLYYNINVREKNKDYQKLMKEIKRLRPDFILLLEVNHAWQRELDKLGQEYPYMVNSPQENSYGLSFLSKHPHQLSINFLEDKTIPSISGTLPINGTDIQFFGLHPKPPAPWNEDQKRINEFTRANKLIRNDLPKIVAGDFNSVPWGDLVQIVTKDSHLSDPRIGRGFYNTYNVFFPFFRMPLDHIFVSKEINVHEFRRGPKVGSDHLPLLMRFSIRP